MLEDIENVSLEKTNIDGRLNYLSPAKRLANMLCSDAICKQMHMRRVQCMDGQVRNDLKNGHKNFLWHISKLKPENIGNNLPESAKNYNSISDEMGGGGVVSALLLTIILKESF